MRNLISLLLILFSFTVFGILSLSWKNTGGYHYRIDINYTDPKLTLDNLKPLLDSSHGYDITFLSRYKSESNLIYLVNESFFKYNPISIISGRFKEGEILIGKQYAIDRFSTIDVIGSFIELESHQYRISGVFDFNPIIIPFYTDKPDYIASYTLFSNKKNNIDTLQVASEVEINRDYLDAFVTVEDFNLSSKVESILELEFILLIPLVIIVFILLSRYIKHDLYIRGVLLRKLLSKYYMKDAIFNVFKHNRINYIFYFFLGVSFLILFPLDIYVAEDLINLFSTKKIIYEPINFILNSNKSGSPVFTLYELYKIILFYNIIFIYIPGVILLITSGKWQLTSLLYLPLVNIILTLVTWVVWDFGQLYLKINIILILFIITKSIKKKGI